MIHVSRLSDAKIRRSISYVNERIGSLERCDACSLCTSSSCVLLMHPWAHIYFLFCKSPYIVLDVLSSAQVVPLDSWFFYGLAAVADRDHLILAVVFGPSESPSILVCGLAVRWLSGCPMELLDTHWWLHRLFQCVVPNRRSSKKNSIADSEATRPRR